MRCQICGEIIEDRAGCKIMFRKDDLACRSCSSALNEFGMFPEEYSQLTFQEIEAANGQKSY